MKSNSAIRSARPTTAPPAIPPATIFATQARSGVTPYFSWAPEPPNMGVSGQRRRMRGSKQVAAEIIMARLSTASLCTNGRPTRAPCI